MIKITGVILWCDLSKPLKDKSLIQNLLSEEKEKAAKDADAFDFLDTTSLAGQPQVSVHLGGEVTKESCCRVLDPTLPPSELQLLTSGSECFGYTLSALALPLRVTELGELIS